MADNVYLDKKAAAKYLGVPSYVLTTLERIGRMGPDRHFLFKKYYHVKKLDSYRREADVDKWKNDERILTMLKKQRTAF